MAEEDRVEIIVDQDSLRHTQELLRLFAPKLLAQLRQQIAAEGHVVTQAAGARLAALQQTHGTYYGQPDNATHTMTAALYVSGEQRCASESASVTSVTVTCVSTVRASVWLMLRLQISTNERRVSSFRFSRMRSMITIVSFTE